MKNESQLKAMELHGLSEAQHEFLCNALACIDSIRNQLQGPLFTRKDQEKPAVIDLENKLFDTLGTLEELTGLEA